MNKPMMKPSQIILVVIAFALPSFATYTAVSQTVAPTTEVSKEGKKRQEEDKRRLEKESKEKAKADKKKAEEDAKRAKEDAKAYQKRLIAERKLYLASPPRITVSVDAETFGRFLTSRLNRRGYSLSQYNPPQVVFGAPTSYTALYSAPITDVSTASDFKVWIFLQYGVRTEGQGQPYAFVAVEITNTSSGCIVTAQLGMAAPTIKGVATRYMTGVEGYRRDLDELLAQTKTDAEAERDRNGNQFKYMSPDENKEFEERKKEIFAPIYLEAGAALFDCQCFESSITYFLYLLGRFGIKDLDPSHIATILDGDEKKTAGQLIVLLKKKVKVSEGIEEVLSVALQARNKIIHRYLYENIERMADFTEHEKIVAEIHVLRSKVQRCQKKLDPFVKHLAQVVDGLNIETFQDDVKRKFVTDSESTDMAKRTQA